MQKIFHSKFNGEVKVKKYLWETSVWVGGFEQSGPLVRDIWQKAIKGLPPPGRGEALRNVLILGLGCGIAAKLLIKKFPQAKITGVEIDPVMIEIGKKYFNLLDIKIKITDAKKFIKTTKQKFDLILVDTYLGGKQVLLKNLKNVLAKEGVVLVNKLENLKNEVLIFKAPLDLFE